MHKTIHGLPLLLALAGAAWAQDSTIASAVACPQLPAESALTWVHKTSPGTEFCRAIRADGREAFGLFIATKSSQKPAGKRAEEGFIEAYEVRWYRGELPNQPAVLVRETVFELDDERSVYVWLHAVDEQQLSDTLAIVQGLSFGAIRLSSN